MSAGAPVPPERKVIIAEYPVCVLSVRLTLSFAVVKACMGSCWKLSVDASALRVPGPLPRTREIQSEYSQEMQAHSEIAEKQVSENMQLKERLEAIKEVQARMDRTLVLVARYGTEEEEWCLPVQ